VDLTFATNQYPVCMMRAFYKTYTLGTQGVSPAFKSLDSLRDSTNKISRFKLNVITL